MLDARAIAKLLLDDELPPGEDNPITDENPEATIDRYLATPTPVRGVPVTLYQEWTKLLHGRKSRFMRELGRSTYMFDVGEAIQLRQHQTNIISVTPENRVTVDTGGWHTRSTMKRINWAAPGDWRLYGRKPRGDAFDEWNLFWYNVTTGAGFHNEKRLLPFTDNDVIEPDGIIRLQAMPTYKNIK